MGKYYKEHLHPLNTILLYKGTRGNTLERPALLTHSLALK